MKMKLVHHEGLLDTGEDKLPSWGKVRLCILCIQVYYVYSVNTLSEIFCTNHTWLYLTVCAFISLVFWFNM